MLPGGLTSLCIPAGIVFRADLYAGAVPSSSTPLPLCDRDTGIFPFPPPGELCVDRKDEGCVAGVNIELKPTGIIMEGSMGAFEIAPLEMRFDDAVVALRLTTADQYLRIHGGVEVGPTTDPTLVGRMALDLGIGTVTFAGQVKAFDFNALVDGSMDVSPLTLLTSTEDFGTLTLHVVLAAPEMALPQYGSTFPDFSEKVRADLELTINELAQIVQFIDDTVADFGDDPLGTLLSLPSRLQEEGYDAGILPAWVALVATENNDAEDEIGDRDESFTLEDLVNGFSLPGVEIGYLTCVGWIDDDGVCLGSDSTPVLHGVRDRQQVLSLATAYVREYLHHCLVPGVHRG